MKWSKLGLMTVICMLAGCGTTWIHPTASQSEFQRDMLACQNQANQSNPRTIVPIQQPLVSAPSSYSTNCLNTGSLISCNTTSDSTGAYNQQMAQANQSIAQGGADLGRALRVSNYYESCMQSRGYTKATSEAIAAKQAQSQSLTNAMTIFNANMNTIFASLDAVCTDARFNLIFSPKTTCKTSALTLGNMADKSKATEEEKKQLLIYDTERRKLFESVIKNYLDYYEPKNKANAFADVYAELNQRSDKNLQNLYLQRITWGEFNQIRKDINAFAQSEFRRVDAIK